MVRRLTHLLVRVRQFNSQGLLGVEFFIYRHRVQCTPGSSEITTANLLLRQFYTGFINCPVDTLKRDLNHNVGLFQQLSGFLFLAVLQEINNNRQLKGVLGTNQGSQWVFTNLALIILPHVLGQIARGVLTGNVIQGFDIQQGIDINPTILFGYSQVGRLRVKLQVGNATVCLKGVE